jgi:diguanylate cyclase (GGDEF)-like protein
VIHLRLPRLQLRLVAICLSLLFAVQAGGYLLIHRSLERNARAEIDTRLGAAAEVAQRLFAERQVELHRLADRLDDDIYFVNAWHVGSAERLAAALRRSQADADAVQVLVLDAALGTRAQVPVGRAWTVPSWKDWLGRIEPGRDSGARLAPRIELLDSDPLTGRAGLRLWIAAPVRASGDAGWITKAVTLDDALLARMRDLAHTELAVLVRRPQAPGWEVRAATLPAGLRAALAEQWAGDDAAQELKLGGAGYRTRFLALAGIGGKADERTQIVLLASVDEALAPYAAMKWTLAGLGVLGLAVFGAGAWLTARRITRPLRELSVSARRLSVGDYEEPVTLKSQDEIGELAQAFETMRQAVSQREAEIRRLAFRDALTDLPNREQFRQDLRRAIAASLARNAACSIVMLDLDRFKHVNDVLGHRFGDRLLKIVAQKLRDEVLGTGDVLARLGGDEFVILLPRTDAQEAMATAQRILRVFERPLTLDDNTVDLGAGIGVAGCPEHATNADQLLARAEIAMYVAKREHAGTVIFHPELDSTSQESLSLLGELRRAIDRDELRLVLQPKVDLRTGQLVGAEALLRWQHPTRGLVPPMRFVPFAEQTGFIRLLTNWLVERVCREQQTLRARGLNLKLSLNLSTRDLMDPDLPGKLQKQIAHYGIEAGAFVLEITESAIMDDPQRALQTLMKLHEMGLKLSIDDFGVGYSSLAYLKRLPVDELKIDKSFVMNMAADLDDAKIVRSTIDLAHNLGLTVVAEGLESAHSWKMLAVLGCDQAQGYFVARPMPADQFADWAQRWVAPDTAGERLATDFVAII